MKKQILITIALLFNTGLMAFDQSASDLMQQALRKEQVDGDLRGAIELYQQIVEKHPSNRPVAAQALVQLGKSRETLGEQQAREAYERVIAEYADQEKEVAEAKNRLRMLDEASPRPGPGKTSVIVQKIGEINAMGTPSPDGRYVAFVNWAQGNLALLETRTGERRDLTTDGGWDGSGAFSDISIWSPDGRQVAYFWITGEKGDLRIIDSRGGEPRVLVPHNEEGSVWPQDWSRDGKEIIGVQFQHDPGVSSGLRRIVSVDVSSGNLRVIRQLPGECINVCLSISPDGQYIAYEFPGRHRDNSEIRMINVDGTGDRLLIAHPANDWSPKWSPDGKHLLFLSDRSGQDGLWVVEMNKGEPAGQPRLLRAGLEAGFRPMGLTDEGALYYGISKTEVNVYMAEVDWNAPAFTSEPRLVSFRFDGKNRLPFWSRDGARLAYLSQRPFHGGMVVIRDNITAEERDLLIPLQRIETPYGFASPIWAPDGQRIILKAMAAEGGRGSALYAVDTLTGKPELLIDKSIGAKTISLDGQYLYYVNKHWDAKHESRIIRRHLASGGEEEIRASDRYMYQITLSPDGSTLAYFEGDSRSSDQQWATALLTTSVKNGTTRTIWEFQTKEGFSGPAGLDWLPDNRLVLLATQDESRRQQLQVLDTKTGEHRALGGVLEGDARIQHLRVHPDGSRIAFSRGAAREEVWALKNFLP